MTSNRKLRLEDDAKEVMRRLAADPAKTGLYRQILKTIELLTINPRHPSLQTHKYNSLVGLNGEEIFEAYAQNRTPGAYRVFFHYGPDEMVKGKRVPMLTIIAITPHP